LCFSFNTNTVYTKILKTANDFAASIDFFVNCVYNAGMSKTILSVFILAVSIIAAVILFGVVRNAYPDFGSFYSLLYIGLIVFGLGVAIFISGLLLEKSIRQIRD